jgi:type IV secretory pathway component VirB8
MRDKIEEEQTQARLREEAIKRQETWQRREDQRNLDLKLAWVLATLFFLLYLWLLFAIVGSGKKLWVG